jgi:hypothetical protein
MAAWMIRVLGLDRAPEVKAIRHKLGGLAAAGRAADWQLAIARHHAAAANPCAGEREINLVAGSR